MVWQFFAIFSNTHLVTLNSLSCRDGGRRILWTDCTFKRSPFESVDWSPESHKTNGQCHRNATQMENSFFQFEKNLSFVSAFEFGRGIYVHCFSSKYKKTKFFVEFGPKRQGKNVKLFSSSEIASFKIYMYVPIELYVHM
jgi:hypothetical protein